MKIGKFLDNSNIYNFIDKKTLHIYLIYVCVYGMLCTNKYFNNLFKVIGHLVTFIKTKHEMLTLNMLQEVVCNFLVFVGDLQEIVRWSDVYKLSK